MPIKNSIAPGTLVANRYRVESTIGRGAMGFVVKAVDTQTDEWVALKLLRQHMVEDEYTVARFLREAEAASRVQSPHVVKVLDFGLVDEEQPYMVMEFLEGHDLAHVRKARAPLPVSEAVNYLLQACDAVAQAHRVGVIHRDLKPANLFVMTGSERIKVLDFGISKVHGAEDGLSLTDTSTMLGSPRYMSPEQMVGARDVDARTDIWALGVILYELLSGQHAFDGESIAGIVHQVVETRITPIEHFRPELSADLIAVVDQCLQKDRGDRFGTADELAAALRPFAEPITPSISNLAAPASTEEDSGENTVARPLDGGPSSTQNGHARSPQNDSKVTPELGDGDDDDRPSQTMVAADQTLVGGSQTVVAPDSNPQGANQGRRLTMSGDPSSEDGTVIADPPIQRRRTSAPRPDVGLPSNSGQDRVWRRIAIALASMAALWAVWSRRPNAASLPESSTRTSSTVVDTPTTRPGSRPDQTEDDPSNAPAKTLAASTPRKLGPTELSDTKSAEPSAPISNTLPSNPATPLPDDINIMALDGRFAVLLEPRGPVSNHQVARKFCDAHAVLSTGGYSGWTLPNPALAKRLSELEPIPGGRYWTSARWKDRARVVVLPSGVTKSRRTALRVAHAICVTETP